MKLKVGLSLLTASYLLTGCVQYVSGYKRSGGGSAEASPEEGGGEEGGGEEGGEEGGGEEGGGEEGGGEEGTGEEGAGEEAPVSLLETCQGCHVEGGEAAGVTLDSTAIPRLNEAHTGKNKDKHTSVATSFEEPNRAALEAELTAIGLRLKGH